jgi:hypothetical protein
MNPSITVERIPESETEGFLVFVDGVASPIRFIARTIMKTRLTAALAVGLTLGLLLPFVGRPEARGHKQEKAPHYEYKVVLSEPDFGSYAKAKSDSDLFRFAGEDLSKQYNQLAEDGWEYEGPVFSVPGKGNEPHRALVVFKRLRK